MNSWRKYLRGSFNFSVQTEAFLLLGGGGVDSIINLHINKITTLPFSIKKVHHQAAAYQLEYKSWDFTKF